MALPLIPGFTFQDPTKTKFHKSQAFVYENGGMATHDNVPGIGGTLLPGQAPPKESISSTMIYNQAMGETNQVGETVPAWVAFGSMVLRFYGYFKEPIYSSQEETYRVRHVTILFFLEDDTIQILEPKEKNSGIPQGTFLRRHRAKKEDDSYITIADFHIGSEFSLYGRTYFINDADKFTHEFLGKLNRDSTTDEKIPVDPYINKREMVEYAETHRNRGVAKPEMLKLRQFLANDGHVLRFYALWDDRNRPFGDLRKFIINYFLADDTMEVLEVRTPNDGRVQAPAFVRRSKVPKRVLSLSENDPRFLPAENYYRPTDLMIGETINILNRQMFIFNCDPWTRQWYIENMAMTQEDMTPIQIEQNQDSLPTVQLEIPPKSLIGSDEDSLQSCLSLHPRPPRKDQQKMLSRLHDVLRFTCHMITNNKVDASRRFIITLYLCDDTVQVYEPPVRNSGIVAGKWLQRAKLINPDTGKSFAPEDFEIGKVLTINGTKFMLDKATEYAMSYMEADPDNFPQADLSSIILKLRDCIKVSGRTSKDLFAEYSDHGVMDIPRLMALFESVGYPIREHEAMTVMRRYELDEENHTLTLREFQAIAP